MQWPPHTTPLPLCFGIIVSFSQRGELLRKLSSSLVIWTNDDGHDDADNYWGLEGSSEGQKKV
eukprot:2588956-Rhodomonas_salina.1